MDNKLLNLKEACIYCGRTEETMRKAIRDKEIPCKFFRGGYLFSKLALDLWAIGIPVENIQDKIEKEITIKLINQVIQEQILVS